MASVLELMAISKDSDFLSRVKYCLQNSALNVMAEENTVPGHALRVDYAKTVLSGGENISQVAICVLTDPTIVKGASAKDSGLSIADDEIHLAIDTIFSYLSGVSA